MEEVPGENKGGVLKEFIWTLVQSTLTEQGDKTPNSFVDFLDLEFLFLFFGIDASSMGDGFNGLT